MAGHNGVHLEIFVAHHACPDMIAFHFFSFEPETTHSFPILPQHDAKRIRKL